MEKTNEQEVGLGDLAKDSISGFEGIVTGITEWLNGCKRVAVSPRELKDSKPIEAQWFDVQQVVVVEKGIYFKSESTVPPGGPQKDPSNNRIGG